MFILLDSHDIIDVIERQYPVNVEELAELLQRKDARLVVSYTNVSELVAGLARGIEFMEFRPRLQALEGLNPAYIREAFIFRQELESAWQGFQNDVEFVKPNPIVQRWDETFQEPGQSAAKMFVQYRLDEIVYNLHRHGTFPQDLSRWIRIIRQQFRDDRSLPATARNSSARHFRLAVERHCQQYRMQIPLSRLDDFSDWAGQDPTRCPGLRLQFEVRRELVGNPNDALKRGDILDFAHIGSVPYIDCATLDRRMYHYCGQAGQKLGRANPNANYSSRTFRNLSELIAAKL